MPSKIFGNWLVFRYICVFQELSNINVLWSIYKLLKAVNSTHQFIDDFFFSNFNPKLPWSTFPTPVCFLQLEGNMYVESKLANKLQTLHLLLTSSPEIYQFPLPVALVGLLIQITVHLLAALGSDNKLDLERITRYGYLFHCSESIYFTFNCLAWLKYWCK